MPIIIKKIEYMINYESITLTSFAVNNNIIAYNPINYFSLLGIFKNQVFSIKSFSAFFIMGKETQSGSQPYPFIKLNLIKII